jgi:hypothetical protein
MKDLQARIVALAAACPACVGIGDGPMAHASRAGIATLMAVTVIVLAGIAAVVVAIARRSRAAARGTEP